MKRLLLMLSLGLILFSCITKPSVEGTFVKVKENDRGTSINVFNKGLVDQLTFGETMCRFNYFGIQMSGEYKVEDNYVYIEVGGELGTLSLEIINEATLEGEGWISGTFQKQ